MRKLRVLQFAVVFEFLVELCSLGHGGPADAVLLELFGCGPIDEGRGEFLPFIALGAEVADAVAFNLIFRDQLVGAVFEDEAAGEFLRLRREHEQPRREQRCEDYPQERQRDSSAREML